MSTATTRTRWSDWLPRTRREVRAPETQRTARILDIIAKICAEPRRWTRQGLASFFEVSERQITKDLEVIRHGLRLELDRKPGGGYYFRTLPTLPAVSYSLSEALAIFLAAQAARRIPGVPQDDLSAAVARLTSIMPPELRPLLNEQVLAPAARDRHREEVLETLTRAIAGRHSVDLVYTPASRPGETSERRVDPYAVVPTGQSWHLVGWCHLRQAVRIFKVDRVVRAEITTERFTPDPEFDLNAFLDAGWGITRGTDQAPEEVLLLFSPMAGRWVAEERWHPSQHYEWLEDGRLRFALRLPVTDEFARWVLRYGSDCEVIQPAHLRDWIVSQSRALLERYGEAGSGARR